MKKVKHLVLALALVILSVLALVACDGSKSDDAKVISVADGTVDGDVISIETGTTVDNLDLAAVLTVSDSATFSVYEDEDCKLAIPDKKVKLSAGENEFFVSVRNGDKSKKYSLNIWKHFNATVSYYINGSFFDSQSVLSHTYLEDFRAPDAIEDIEFLGWECEGYYVETQYIRFDAKINKTLNVKFNGEKLDAKSVNLEYAPTVEEIDFTKLFKISEWASWDVYRDDGKFQWTVYDKKESLKDGLNKYCVVIDPNGLNKKIEVNVFRNYYADVYYYIDGKLFAKDKVLSHTYLDDFRTPENLALGINFISWNCQGYYVDSPIVNIDAQITHEKCDITLNADGGTCETDSLQIDLGKQFKLPVPSREGYNFAGWYLGTDRVTENNGNSYDIWSIAGNSELIAAWTAQEYEITFDSDLYDIDVDITNGFGEKYKYGKTYTATLKILNPAYAFLGWFIDDELVCDEIEYTFTVSQTKDIEVRLKFEYREEFSIFDYTVSYDTVTITGVKDKTVTELVFPDSIDRIADGALAGLSNLKTLTIPWLPTSLGMLFGKREYYESVKVDTGEYLYSYYYLPSTLESVTIKGGVIANGAFRNCSMLKSVTIGENVTCIGEKAFYNCSQLDEIEYKNDVMQIGSYAFENTAWYDNQPSGMVYVGRVAYEYKGGATAESSTFVLRKDTVRISDFAFSECTAYGITKVVIPKEVEYVGSEIFFGCGSISVICEVESMPDGWDIEWLKASSATPQWGADLSEFE